MAFKAFLAGVMMSGGGFASYHFDFGWYGFFLWIFLWSIFYILVEDRI